MAPQRERPGRLRHFPRSTPEQPSQPRNGRATTPGAAVSLTGFIPGKWLPNPGMTTLGGRRRGRPASVSRCASAGRCAGPTCRRSWVDRAPSRATSSRRNRAAQVGCAACVRNVLRTTARASTARRVTAESSRRGKRLSFCTRQGGRCHYRRLRGMSRTRGFRVGDRRLVRCSRRPTPPRDAPRAPGNRREGRKVRARSRAVRNTAGSPRAGERSGTSCTSSPRRSHLGG